MAADEASGDPNPTGGKNPPVVEEEEKTSRTEDHKGSMLPPFIYDTFSVTERLMQRADAGANEDSGGDGETSEGIHPNNTEAKDSNHEDGPGKGDSTSMLGPSVYDVSLLGNRRLIQRAMAAMAATVAARTTTPSTKDEPSTDIEVKDIEGSGEAMAKL
ncbi:hypothetical protein CEP53_015004 [Fusarium sp. AF-6]|nr:hypothetical protein CEP53_015004 [Fusarium sp. AF-6]